MNHFTNLLFVIPLTLTKGANCSTISLSSYCCVEITHNYFNILRSTLFCCFIQLIIKPVYFIIRVISCRCIALGQKEMSNGFPFNLTPITLSEILQNPHRHVTVSSSKNIPTPCLCFIPSEYIYVIPSYFSFTDCVYLTSQTPNILFTLLISSIMLSIFPL